MGVKEGCTNLHEPSKLTMFQRHFDSTFSPGTIHTVFHKPLIQCASMPAILYKMIQNLTDNSWLALNSSS